MSKSVFRGAAALAVISIISKLLGAFYRIPLTNILGAEGMGLYQTVFPVFTVLLMICGGGMTGAVSRTVAKYSARGNGARVKDILFAAAVPLFVFSVVAAAAVIGLRRVISTLQGVPNASMLYLVLCPSLVLCSVISVLRGIFQGRSMMMPSGISQLVEQGIKLGLGLVFAKMLMPRGVEYAAAGALLGVTASEFSALVYLIVRYLAYSKKRLNADGMQNAVVSRRELFKEVIKFSLPVTAGMLVIPLTQVFDSAAVVNMLVGAGTERSKATALFGLFVGPVGTLINMPAVMLSALSAALLPALTGFVERGDCDGVKKESASALSYVLIISVPIAAAFMLFPRQICSVLYGSGLSGEEIIISSRLLRIEGISVLYVGFISYTTAALQAQGKAHVPAINLAFGAAAKVVLSLILIPRIGIYGAAASNAVCYAVAALLGAMSAAKNNLSVGVSADIVLRPMFFTALSCTVFYAVSSALGGGRAATVVAGAAFMLVYLCIIPSLNKSRHAPLLGTLFGKQKRLKK